MRFIGSKNNMLDNIKAVIHKNTSGNEHTFCDIFSGSGAVARYFKPEYEIYSNDLMNFSYVIQKATIENNAIPAFNQLKTIGIDDPITFLEDTNIETYNYNDDHFFIAKNYSPHDNCSRMYISNKNAVRIDFIRNTIESWKCMNLLSEMEYYYLLAALIEGVPFISNITGTYGAYLKTWDRRALKEFEMARLDVIDNKRNNRSFNVDANKLINEIEGDILYIDPPYNSRQYLPNYHLLETISKYDHPAIYGKTGMRDYTHERSSFCVKNEVLDVFEDLIAKAKFENIVMSYSTDGLMTSSQIEDILKKYGIPKTYKLYVFPYRKYKSKIVSHSQNLSEYLFFIKKDIPSKYIVDLQNPLSKQTKSTTHKSITAKKYIKSPLNYIGGKYKLLPQILSYFPQKINTFIDLFAGACNVGINVVANKIICNDINTKIIDMYREFQALDIEYVLAKIDSRINEYQLSKENQDGFLRFRKFYNTTHNPIDLYTLSCYSFNYQFRFNNNLEYNNPFGRNRSQFSNNMRNNLILFSQKLKNANIEFMTNNFQEFPIESYGATDLIYCDPPYFITTGTYNDGNRGFKDWKAEQEYQLYDFLDRANAKGIRFALSNVLEHKGQKNQILSKWSKKYKVIDINMNYSNCNYHAKNRTENTREVLIINY